MNISEVVNAYTTMNILNKNDYLHFDILLYKIGKNNKERISSPKNKLVEKDTDFNVYYTYNFSVEKFYLSIFAESRSNKISCLDFTFCATEDIYNQLTDYRKEIKQLFKGLTNVKKFYEGNMVTEITTIEFSRNEYSKRRMCELLSGLLSKMEKICEQKDSLLSRAQ